MDEPIKERYVQLCELAANEKDPHKLIALVEEINRLFREKEELLEAVYKGSEVS